MLQISNLQLSLDENPQSLEPLIMKKLRLRPGRLTSWKIVKESLDARKKPLRFVYTVLAETPDEAQILKKKLPHVSAAEPYIYQPPRPLTHGKERPVVVGFGPCGMFAALLLAEAGLRPIVLERGADVDQRVKDVEAYWQGGPLNPQSNVQFGEGGAGTFSDGKLTTRVKDVRIVKVTDELIEAGADPEIGYQAHPHIGTDRLRQIVKNIRLKIQRLGGEVRFNTPMTGIFTDADGICAIQAGDQRIACRQFPGEYRGVAVGFEPFHVLLKAAHGDGHSVDGAVVWNDVVVHQNGQALSRTGEEAGTGQGKRCGCRSA